MRRLRDNQARMHLVMMLTLTFSTGIVDAVGYLGLDRVFTANMTGNVVILGMAIAQADGLPILGPVIALLRSCSARPLGGRLLRGGRGRAGRAAARSPSSITGAVLLGLGLTSSLACPRRARRGPTRSPACSAPRWACRPPPPARSPSPTSRPSW